MSMFLTLHTKEFIFVNYSGVQTLSFFIKGIYNLHNACLGYEDYNTRFRLSIALEVKNPDQIYLKLKTCL